LGVPQPGEVATLRLGNSGGSGGNFGIPAPFTSPGNDWLNNLVKKNLNNLVKKNGGMILLAVALITLVAVDWRKD
jgi:hypothetical protein